MDKIELTVYVMVDKDGDFAVHKDEEDLAEAFTDTCGDPVLPCAFYECRITVPTPRAIVLRGEVHDQPNEGVLTVEPTT